MLKYWADKTGKDFCEYTAGLVEAATDSPKAVLEFGKDQFMGSAKSTIYGWLHMSTIGNEVENMRSTLYWRAIEAEKKGYHVNWDKFPFDEDLPDPRKKQDDDQPQPTDQPKKPSEMTPQEFEEAVKRAEEIVRQIEEEQRRKKEQEEQNPNPNPDPTPPEGDDGGIGGIIKKIFNPEPNDTPTPAPTPTPNPTTTPNPNTDNVPIPDERQGIIDPSGFVYAGVESERLADVEATIFQLLNGVRKPWDATAYDQANPLTTGTDGAYEWMVPTGRWAMTFAKSGYDLYDTRYHATDGIGATAETDGSESGKYYMPVAPAQLGVNINMQKATPPEVMSRTADDQGVVYLAFDQYMQVNGYGADDLASLIRYNLNAAEVGFTAEYVDAERSATDASKMLARTVKLTPETTVTSADTVIVHVDHSVKSYGNKTMKADYTSPAVPLGSAKQVGAPVLKPDAGAVEPGATLEISAPTKDTGGADLVTGTVKLYYTTDGSEPTRASKLYTGPITLTEDTTLKVIAVSAGLIDGEVLTATYTIKRDEPTPTPTPYRPPVRPEPEPEPEPEPPGRGRQLELRAGRPARPQRLVLRRRDGAVVPLRRRRHHG